MATESFLVRLQANGPQHVLNVVDHEALRVSATLLTGDWPVTCGFTIEGSNDGLTWTTVRTWTEAPNADEVASPYLMLRARGYGSDPGSPLRSIAQITVEYLDNLAVSSVEVLHHDGDHDAFHRLRVSNPRALFDSKQLFDDGPLLWDESLTGAAGSTHSTVNAATTLDVSLKNDSAIRQTFRRFNYQPGRSQLVFMTTVFGAATEGVTKRVGLFDDDNGLFWQQDGDGMAVVVRKNGTDSVYRQADWNKDKLLGYGESGLTFDPTKAIILAMDFEWLGVGLVRFQVIQNGNYINVHDQEHCQIVDSVYMSTPNLPLRYEISTDQAAVAELVHICSAVLSEGGQADNFIPRSASTNGTHVDANVADTLYAIVGMRLKSTHLGATVFPVSVDLLAETNDKFEWVLLHNPTVAAPFAYVAEANSAVEIARGATANTVSGGTRLAGGWGSTTNPFGAVTPGQFALGSTIAGTPSTLVLCARPLGANADIQGTINWAEVL